MSILTFDNLNITRFSCTPYTTRALWFRYVF